MGQKHVTHVHVKMVNNQVNSLFNVTCVTNEYVTCQNKGFDSLRKSLIYLFISKLNMNFCKIFTAYRVIF